MLRLEVNGTIYDTEAGTVLELLESMDISQRMIVVEADGHILHKSEWGGYHLKDGMKIEIVQFVGGG